MFKKTTPQTIIDASVRSWVSKYCVKQVSKQDYLNLAEALPSNDLDAAEFISDTLGSQITYIPTSKTGGDWYYWNGKVHQKASMGLVDDDLATALADFLKQTLPGIHHHITEDFDEDGAKKLRAAFGPVVEYQKRIRGEASHSKLRKRVQVAFTKPEDYFDQDQRWAVMADGQVIDLANLDAPFLEPDPNRAVSKKMGLSAHETSPEAFDFWQSTLDSWLPDKEDQRYLQVAAGAALLGRGDAKNIVTLVGISNTGKSTYIRTMAAVFGDYAGSLPVNAIVQKYGGSTNFDQYKARGKRFLYLEEPQNTRTDDSFLKNLSGGGGVIPTQEKGKNVVEWRAQCVLHIAANHVPKVDHTDNAIVERLDIIPFDHVFNIGSAERTERLEDVLFDTSGVAILLWVLEGAAEYLKTGVIPKSDAIKARAKRNAVKSSATLKWLEDVTAGDFPQYVIAPSANLSEMATQKDAYQLFQIWCNEAGEKVVPKRSAWLDELEKHLGAPSNFREKRPGGYARVYGLLPSSTNKSAGLHNLGSGYWKDTRG
ncbi:primase [Paenarthrobacter nicotinovorans]|nr:primase [Paenarthrobacter nicotinovorans]